MSINNNYIKFENILNQENKGKESTVQSDGRRKSIPININALKTDYSLINNDSESTELRLKNKPKTVNSANFLTYNSINSQRRNTVKSKPFLQIQNDGLEIIDEKEERLSKEKRRKSKNENLNEFSLEPQVHKTPKIISERKKSIKNNAKFTPNLKIVKKTERRLSNNTDTDVKYSSKELDYKKRLSIFDFNSAKIRKENSISPNLFDKNKKNSFTCKKDYEYRKKKIDDNKSKSAPKNNDLTIEKIVSDFNKNFITFTRRQTYKQKVLSTFMEGATKNKLNENNNSRRSLSLMSHLSQKHENEVNHKLKENLQQDKLENKYWRKIRIIVNCIGTIMFLKQEIVLYGITPKFKKRIILEEEVVENDNMKSLDKTLKKQSSEADTIKKKIVHMKSFDNIFSQKNKNNKSHKSLEPKKQKTTKLIYKQNNKTISEVQLSSKKAKYILLPEYTFIKYWNFFMFLVYFYSLTVIPFRIAFYNNYFDPSNIAFFIFDTLIQIIFLIHFILNFVTGYYNIEGIIEVKLSKITINYLGSWFGLDLICLIPYNAYWRSYSRLNVFDNYDSNWLELLPLLRIIKLSSLLSNVRMADNVSIALKLTSGKLKLLLFFIESTIICHCFACIWYFSTQVDSMDNTWTNRYNWVDDSIGIKYLKSLYFTYVVFITVGYGDIVPFTNPEVILCILFMFFTAIYYTYYITLLSNIFMNMQTKRLQFNDKSMMISDVCKSAKIIIKLEENIKKFVKYRFENDISYYTIQELKYVLNELSSTLRLKIGMSIYNGFYKKIKILQNSNKAFISNIIILMELEFYNEKKSIYNCDEVPEKIYFILEGKTVIKTEDEISFATLNNGSYFGEIEIIRKTYRDFTVIAETNCQLITLKKQIIYEDITVNHSEFFALLIQNMIKRHKFYELAKQKIDKIIQRGREIAKNLNNLKALKEDLPNIVNYNYNKQYFYIGLQDLIKINSKKLYSKKATMKDKQLSTLSLKYRQPDGSDKYSNNIINNKEIDQVSKLKIIESHVFKNDNLLINDNNNLDDEYKSRKITVKNRKISRKLIDDNSNTKKITTKPSQGYNNFIKKLTRVNLKKLKKINNSIKNSSEEQNLNFMDKFLSKLSTKNKLNEIKEEEDPKSVNSSFILNNQKSEIQLNIMIKELKAIKIQNIDIQKCILSLIKSVDKKIMLNSSSSDASNSSASSKSIQKRLLKKKSTIKNIIFNINDEMNEIENEYDKKDDNSLKVSEEIYNEFKSLNLNL